MMLGVTAARVQPHAVEADAPTLHWELERWHHAFLRNLGDLLLRREPPPLEITAKPAPLRQNYFIRTGVDATRFVESYSYHIVLVTAVYLFCTLPFFNRAPQLRSPFENTQVQYVPLSEYLPPINTAAKAQMKPRKGAPKLAKQEILSVPPNADNSQQTIVTPPKIKLEHDVALPNIVAWTPIPAAQPVSASARTVSQLRVPQLEPDVVAPAADTSRLKLKAPRLEADVAAPTADVTQLKAKLQLPNLQPSVVDPPLSQNQLKMKSGDINMAQLEPQVAAPKLPVEPQRASRAGDAAKGGGSSDKVAPAPDLQGVPSGQGQGQIIALGLNPNVRGPVNVPAGNRSGEFHASPSGKVDAPGTPNVTGTGTADQGGGHGAKNGVPPGIVVGAPPPGTTTAGVAGTPNGNASKGVTNPDLEARKRMIAEAMRPTLPSVRERPAPPPAVADDPAASIEQRVFGPKRYYLMIMNMPNLASASGSWIIRYAELQQSEDQGPLAAPVATLKVDPAYAPDALRDRVEGTVTLYAIIRPDGSVDGIRVLDSLDSRLDANAVRALAGWHFRPGTKNGTPVAVEAVVQIPFHLTRLR